MIKKEYLLPIIEKLDKMNRQCESKSCFYWIDYVGAFLFAICPLLQHYVGPLFNAGISVLVLLALYLMCRIVLDWTSIKRSNLLFVLPIVVYQLYRVVNHGTSLTEVGQSGVFIIFMFALALGKINIGIVLKICRGVAMIASCILILQTLIYYVFGVHMQVVVTSWLIPAAEQWIGGAKTGLISISGRLNNFYRPTAFFLEPAHVYIYMFPHLLLLLIGDQMTKKRFWMAALISCGMLLCTSGMGIAAVVGSWALFFLLRDKEGTLSWKNMLQKRNLIALSVFAAVFIVAAFTVPPLRRAINRIFVPNKFGVTAISGRISEALKLVSDMTVDQWLTGVVDNTQSIEFHMPGFIDVLYRHGLLGLILSYELYVKCICKLSIPYKIIGGVILITSIFSAHTQSTTGMLYYVLILMNGFQKMEPQHAGVKPYRINEEKENACLLLRTL